MQPLPLIYHWPLHMCWFCFSSCSEECYKLVELHLISSSSLSTSEIEKACRITYWEQPVWRQRGREAEPHASWLKWTEKVRSGFTRQHRETNSFNIVGATGPLQPDCHKALRHHIRSIWQSSCASDHCDLQISIWQQEIAVCFPLEEIIKLCIICIKVRLLDFAEFKIWKRKEK